MKKSILKKLIICSLMIASVSMINSVKANAEWKKDSIGWKYVDNDSYYIGWKQIDGNWYYFYYGGYMAHETFIDGCYLGENGAWTNNLGTKGTELYYKQGQSFFEEKEITQEMRADLNRKLSSGITLGQAEKNIEDSIRKLSNSGASYEDLLIELDNKIKEYGTSKSELHHIVSTGNKSWQKNNEEWFFKEDNSYAIGWRWIDGRWYYFNTDGSMKHDEGMSEKFRNGTTGFYRLGTNGYITSSTLHNPNFILS